MQICTVVQQMLKWSFNITCVFSNSVYRCVQPGSAAAAFGCKIVQRWGTESFKVIQPEMESLLFPNDLHNKNLNLCFFFFFDKVTSYQLKFKSVRLNKE